MILPGKPGPCLLERRRQRYHYVLVNKGISLYFALPEHNMIDGILYSIKIFSGNFYVFLTQINKDKSIHLIRTSELFTL
jgi:hypothetical protein